MNEYLGVKYKDLGNGKWDIVWPSGMKGKLFAQNEDAVKKIIDEMMKK